LVVTLCSDMVGYQFSGWFTVALETTMLSETVVSYMSLYGVTTQKVTTLAD